MLLKVWADQFQHLGESRLGRTPDSCERKRMVDSLEMSSHFDEDRLLDVLFTMEDVFRAINKNESKQGTGTRWADG